MTQSRQCTGPSQLAEEHSGLTSISSVQSSSVQLGPAGPAVHGRLEPVRLGQLTVDHWARTAGDQNHMKDWGESEFMFFHFTTCSSKNRTIFNLITTVMNIIKNLYSLKHNHMDPDMCLHYIHRPSAQSKIRVFTPTASAEASLNITASHSSDAC